MSEALERSGLYSRCRAIHNKMKDVGRSYKNDHVSFFKTRANPDQARHSHEFEAELRPADKRGNAAEGKSATKIRGNKFVIGVRAVAQSGIVKKMSKSLCL